jgi:hypothetical protein
MSQKVPYVAATSYRLNSNAHRRSAKPQNQTNGTSTCESWVVPGVVDPDPDSDLVGSAEFCRIRVGVGIQAMPIRKIQIGINSRHMYFI